MKVTGIQTILISVDDMEETIRFYGDLLGLEKVYEHHGRVAFAAGPTRLLFHVGGRADGNGGSAVRDAAHGIELYLSVDDVDGMVERLRSEHVVIRDEPTDEPWGERDAAALDPSGHPIFLTQALAGTWAADSRT
jgi:catechol 2,3-dioxygenase-like lactoylglutathione lyase family enzyme